MKAIDNFLNKITMYRLVVYVLATYSIAGITLASFGRIYSSPLSMFASLALLIGSCYATDLILAKIWRAPYNKESWLITALILFLIIRPPQNLREAVVTAAAGLIACSSKYILTWHGKHVFNPAALAAAFLSLSSLQIISWWVGNASLWPLTLICGLAIARKVRRFQLIITFVLVSVILQLILITNAHQPLSDGIRNVLIASPLIFLSTIMLTEPATMPPRRNQQLVFAALVAVLYAEAWKIGPLRVYPEVALLLGNVFAFAVSPGFKARLQLKEIQKVSDQVYSFIFQPDRKMSFLPGQYMEWTLAGVPFDARGNRRAFTIASSPTEEDVRIGVKFYKPSSMFKYTLSQMKPGDFIYASQLAGNFTLSGNERKKMVFIAGGIGVTPFRSMIKYITDKNIQSDIILIYSLSKPEELAYKNEFLAARQLGVKLIPVLNAKAQKVQGMVSAELNDKLISWAAPDYKERVFYVSGPDGMVRSTKRILQRMSVADKNIKTDYFSGY